VLLLAALAGCGEQSGKPSTANAAPVAQGHIGSESCSECHQAQYQAWQGSHHQLAMALPDAQTVRADFANITFSYGDTVSAFNHLEGRYIVRTDGANGQLADFAVQYTFGVEPLQQYLLTGPDGRLQALGVSWDSRPESNGGQRWFHLHPDENVDYTDVLHWTRPSANWNFMCADCHSTAFGKNYDPVAQAYDSHFAEVSVGCEACHGRGAQHVAWARGDHIAPAILPLTSQQAQVNTCAPCHSRRSQLADGFLPGADFFDHYLPSLLDEGLYHADGQILDEVYVYGSFVQSRMHEKGVKCSHCHEPHSARVRMTGNGLCTQCHNEVGRPGFPTLPHTDFDSAAHHHHPIESAGARCVSCHMRDTTYMVVDDRRDHSFRIPRPDLSVELGVPNACNDCHVENSPQWAASAVSQWYGEQRKPHFASVLQAARRGEPNVESALAKLATDAGQPGIVRATALSLMANYTLRVTSAALENGLNDDSPLIRIGALRGAQRWPGPLRWRLTRRLLDDPALAVRVEAVRGLANTVPELAAADQEALRPYLQWYLGVLAFNADVAEGQSNIASIHLALGDIPGAEAALGTSLELNPQWVPGMVNLADLYRATGRDPLGGALLDEAVGLAPEAPDVLLAKALWMVRQGDAAGSLPLLQSAWRAAPHHPRYAYVLAVALHSADRSGEALDVVDQALSTRRDEQLLQTAISIARDANLPDKMRRYAQMLQGR